MNFNDLIIIFCFVLLIFAHVIIRYYVVVSEMNNGVSGEIKICSHTQNMKKNHHVYTQRVTLSLHLITISDDPSRRFCFSSC